MRYGLVKGFFNIYWWGVTKKEHQLVKSCSLKNSSNGTLSTLLIEAITVIEKVCFTFSLSMFAINDCDTWNNSVRTWRWYRWYAHPPGNRWR